MNRFCKLVLPEFYKGEEREVSPENQLDGRNHKYQTEELGLGVCVLIEQDGIHGDGGWGMWGGGGEGGSEVGRRGGGGEVCSVKKGRQVLTLDTACEEGRT